MTNRTSDLEGAKVATFRRRPQALPRQRRSSGDELRHGQVLTTKVGLQIPAGMSYEDWEQAGRQLSGIVDSSSWWLGDWLVHGKDHYTDRYQRGIRTAGLQYQTLRNYAWVARRFEFGRRRHALTFQHHAEIASLPVEEQELWLDRAEQKKWTTKQLRGALRMARADEPRSAKQLETTRRLALPGSRLQWWHKAAEQSGLGLEQWVLETLDSAAGQALDEMAEMEEVQERASISA